MRRHPRFGQGGQWVVRPSLLQFPRDYETNRGLPFYMINVFLQDDSDTVGFCRERSSLSTQRLGRMKELRPRVLIDQCISPEVGTMLPASSTVPIGFIEDIMR